MTEMQQQIIEWLANGETGLSSETMAFVIGFGVMPKRAHYPLDPSDLRRCLQLLTAAPAMRHGLEAMADVCPVWAEIVNNWAELEETYCEESKQDRMPRTYALLQRCAEKDKKRIVIGNGISISVS